MRDCYRYAGVVSGAPGSGPGKKRVYDLKHSLCPVFEKNQRGSEKKGRFRGKPGAPFPRVLFGRFPVQVSF